MLFNKSNPGGELIEIFSTLKRLHNVEIVIYMADLSKQSDLHTETPEAITAGKKQPETLG